MPKKPMISKIENKSKSKVRERDHEHRIFNVENLRRDQKSQAYHQLKNSTMKNKNQVQGFT